MTTMIEPKEYIGICHNPATAGEADWTIGNYEYVVAWADRKAAKGLYTAVREVGPALHTFIGND